MVLAMPRYWRSQQKEHDNAKSDQDYIGLAWAFTLVLAAVRSCLAIVVEDQHAQLVARFAECSQGDMSHVVNNIASKCL